MRKAVIILFTLIPFLIGCKEMILTQHDSGKTVTVKTGNIIKVELVSNSSTGNSWYDIKYDNQVIEKTGKPVYRRNENGKIGSPGKVLFTFKALKKGTTDLTMLYGRKDSNKKSVKKFQVKIVVK